MIGDWAIQRFDSAIGDSAIDDLVILAIRPNR
jgi:hypothetical protein